MSIMVAPKKKQVFDDRECFQQRVIIFDMLVDGKRVFLKHPDNFLFYPDNFVLLLNTTALKASSFLVQKANVIESSRRGIQASNM